MQRRHRSAHSRRAVRRSRRSSRGSGTSSCVARAGRRRLHQRPAPGAVLRRVGRLRRAPRLRAGRRHPARRLEAVRADRPLLRQGVRSGHERELLGAARRVEVDGLRSRGITKLEYASYPRGVPATCRTGSATASASSRSTATSSNYVPPSAKHFNVLLHTLDRAQRRAAGPHARAPLEQARRALRAPQHRSR